MPRFHLPPAACEGPELRLTGAEAAHATRVLRLRPGDRVTVLDGAGSEYDCQIAALARGEARLVVRESRRHPPPMPALILLPAVLKARGMDWLLQKATELGATEIRPVLTRRCVPEFPPREAERKRAKWEAVAVEAMKQCGAPWLPRVAPPRPLSAFLTEPPPAEPALLADLSPAARPLRELLAAWREQPGWPPKKIALWIGPEGDFTPEEREALLAHGAHPVSFGPRVLRSETAALYGLSVLGYECASPNR